MYSTIVSPNDAWQYQQSHHAVFLDCRFALFDAELGHRQYLAEHTPGAVYANLNTDLSSEVIHGVTGRHPMPGEHKFVEFVESSGISNDTQVFAYDDSGGPYAARAWWLLQYFGHDHIAVIDGGWAAWKSANLPVSSDVIHPTRGIFRPSARQSMVSTVGDIEQAHTKDQVLVDARAENRYLGIEEPIDSVAGHIPGALSFPFMDNLRSDRSFKSPADLEDRYSSLVDAEKVVSYCGSGVTGAHNVLAMVMAGLPMPSLYVGSWSEWITDGRRAIETGK
jgi:thiosulfate/3-mercaptopyruvate sulfurtransferase